VTEFLQDTPPAGNDILKLMQYRIQQSEKRDVILDQKLDHVIGISHDIKTSLALGEKRMETHSGLIEALKDDTDSLKERHRIEVDAMKKAFQEEIRAAVSAPKSEPVTVWTAITGAGTGLGAIAYIIYTAITGKPPP
jgi:hypothetical protein